MGVVVHNQKAGVDDSLAGHRNVVEHIGGLFNSCRRVDVASELRSNPLEVFQQGLLGEILGSVEAHMLKEVRKTVLIRGLLNGADICGEVELSPLGRFVVVTDVIGHSVLEFPHPDFGVIGKLRLRETSDGYHQKSRNTYY